MARRMLRPARIALPVTLVAGAAALFGACGTETVSVPRESPLHKGAVLFAENCSGCHTLSVAGTQGTSVNIRDFERTDGPNLNKRREQKDQVLYAIRNGGFSGAIMPQNIVTGPEAQAVAAFVAKYAGAQAARQNQPSGSPPPGF